MSDHHTKVQELFARENKFIFLILDLDPSEPWFTIPPKEKKKRKKRKSFQPPLKTTESASIASDYPAAGSSVSHSTSSSSTSVAVESKIKVRWNVYTKFSAELKSFTNR